MNRIDRHRFEIALGGAVVIGLAIRLMLIIRSGWRIDYDEAMIGLLGLRVMRGEWMAFIPAQPTLGAIEAYLLAPVFALLGANAVTFRLVSLALSAAYIASTGVLARRAYGDKAGGLAALLAGIAPPYMLISSLRTWGATIETIILGNLLLIATANVIEEKAGRAVRAIDLMLMGLIAGVMFWIAWLGAYYFIPAALLLVWQGRRALMKGWWPAAIAFLAGSLPFWLFNLRHNFATFSTALGGTPLTGEEWRAILSHAWVDLLPRLVSGNPGWQVSGPCALVPLLVLYYSGLLCLLIWPLIRSAFPQRGSSLRRMLAIFVLTVPILYLFSGYSRNALNQWGVDATSRYVVMLHTALPIGLAVLASAVSRWRSNGNRSMDTAAESILSRMGSFFTRGIAASMVLLVIGLNMLGAIRVDPVVAFDSPYYDRLPVSLDPLIRVLDEQGITHVWIDTPIGHVLMFETRERILAADYYDLYIAEGLIRFPDALAAVQAAPQTAFVVPIMAGQIDPPLQRALDATGVSYTAIEVTPTLMLYIADGQLDPAAVAQGIGYQY
ncbi:MAG: hypothetical protein JXB07_06350 [Anaerolineae bacterium]|nr:hypothetical protein [Anaerolineae bacterium]